MRFTRFQFWGRDHLLQRVDAERESLTVCDGSATQLFTGRDPLDFKMTHSDVVVQIVMFVGQTSLFYIECFSDVFFVSERKIIYDQFFIF